MTILRIGWRCEACGRPIDDGAGALLIRYSDRHRLAEYRATHEGQTIWTADELAEIPIVPWHALHDACDEPEIDAAYVISIETVRTPERLLERTAHLLGKPWIQDTDWSAVIHRAVST